ncbi:MAG: hypothetical protein KGI05_09760, partial [Thaumarchaeota archaeon]|nr:hypothetical protein [Nitrososphaerota archaeon]
AQYGGFKNRAQHLPWSTIGYDYVHNSLEVTILPEYFTTDAIPKYFEKIRSIVGNDVDITLSPLPYPVAPVGYDVMPVIEIGVPIAVVASIVVLLFTRKKRK